MSSHLVRLRERNQLTLPSELAEKLAVAPGSWLELILGADGDGTRVELRHAQVVRAGTPQAKRQEQAALEDIKQGRFSTFANPGELARDLEERRAKAEMEERIDSLQARVDELMQRMRNVTQGEATAETRNTNQGQAEVTEPMRTQIG